MENKFNLGSFLIGMFVVILLLLPTVIKLSNKQKEKTLQEFAEYKVDSTFMPFSLDYEPYVAQFYQASKTGEGSIKKVEVLLLNKNTNETYKYNIILDGYDYDYLHKNAIKFVEGKLKHLPDKPIVKEPIKTINDTINDVHITEYGHYRCTMILKPGKDNPNEVLIYLQDKQQGIIIPLHTTVNEYNTWDSLKAHSKEFMQRSITLMFE